MKIAVTSQDRAKVTGHAGRCWRFWSYEVSDGVVTDKTLLEIDKAQTFHQGHGDGGHPLDDHDVLISAGMGTGLARRLGARGIEAVVTSEGDPDTAVRGFLAGTLPRGTPHAHGHGHHRCS